MKSDSGDGKITPLHLGMHLKFNHLENNYLM
jgi:hypothetical protein